MQTDSRISKMIERLWVDDYCDYLSKKDREFLVKRNILEKWKDAFFLDLVDRYQGSCRSLSGRDQDFLEEFDLFQDLDDIQFECAHCGWWHELCDIAEGPQGNTICTDCAEENEE